MIPTAVPTAVRTGLAVLATVAATGVALAVPASAQTAEPHGRATANGGLIARSLPTPFSKNLGTVAKGKVFPITCQVDGSVIYKGDPDDGNVSNIWYRLPAANQWVSAAYVDLVGSTTVPTCGDDTTTTGRVTTAILVRREAPTTRANAHGAYTTGTRLSLVCKLDGQTVNGNKIWYLTTDDLWVSARYVANVGRAPAFCTR
ncbi:MAG: hypothetical protein ACR2LI_02590 [Propionibacteriaceae bacterium]